jgi:chromosome partitioning protein
VTDPREAVDVHLADALIAMDLGVVRSARAVADLGAGAGVPGLPLAVALPEARVRLVESVGRKATFLRRAVQAMGLANVEVVATRAEAWPEGLGSSDLATARALAPLDVLVEYAAPLLVEGGSLVAWKGRRNAAEEAAGARAARALGLEPAEVRRVQPWAGARDHHLHVYAKVRPTPTGFPRRPGVARKRPLGSDVLITAAVGAGPTAAVTTVAAVGTIFAIANQKGGVGKTTTAVNVAACIAEAGYRTLLVDIDPQANATVGLGLAKDHVPSVYDVLHGAPAADAIRDTAIEALKLLPANPDLAGANVELPRRPGSEIRLREALAPLRDAFAHLLLDCPPSLGPLTVNALVAADRVIVPVQAEYFALEGLAGLLDTLALVRRELNPRLQVAGMLLTMYDGRTRLARDVEREVRQHFPELVFDTVIPRNVRVGEAPSFGRPVIHHDPHSAGSDAYFALAREVTARA